MAEEVKDSRLEAVVASPEHVMEDHNSDNDNDSDTDSGPDDTLAARISDGCPATIQAVLRAAWRHDVDALRPLLRDPPAGQASVRDPVTGETPLHAAVRGCSTDMEGRPKDSNDSNDNKDKDKSVIAVMQLLFQSGAIWNDVDDHNETPGCVAWRLGHKAAYEQCLAAGTRAEMLFALLEGYEALGSEEEEEEEGEEEENPEVGEEKDETKDETEDEQKVESESKESKTESASANKPDNQDEPYLDSHLTLDDGKLVDAAGNGVMMAWEKDIMQRSVDALWGGPADKAAAPAAAAAAEPETGKRVLNIGFGLGIIDSMIAARHPARHHIIEAHPDVLARLDNPKPKDSASTSTSTSASDDDHASEFGPAWEASGSEPGAFHVYRGRWQDIVPQLMAAGELYDAVYFDTFGEDYAQLRRFFTDYIPGLLDFGGVFGFFHGLGADRRICYDVYTRVVEMHLSEAGLEVAWEDVAVPLQEAGLAQAGEGVWSGIVRPYWTLDTYRLPTCTFLG